MYNVANSIITDRKMYRCIFKVSFYFRGSLYEINVLLPLFLQMEVSIVSTTVYKRKFSNFYSVLHSSTILYFAR